MNNLINQTNNQEWVSTADNLYKIQEKIKKLEEKKDKLMKSLKYLSQESSSMGGSFIFLCSTRKGSVDYAQIPVLKGIDLERYRKNSVYVWKLTKIEVLP